MAGSIKGLTVEIGGDTTKLGKALEGVQKKSKNLSSELGQINKLLKMDPGNAELLAQKQKVLADAVANTREKLETLKKANEQATKSAENYDAWKAKYAPIQAEIDELTQKLKKLKAEQAEVADAEGIESEAYQQMQAEVKELTANLKTLKKQAQAVTDEFGNPSSPEQLRELQREVVATSNKLKSYEKAADETAQAIEKLGKESGSAGDDLNETGDGAKKSAKNVDDFADAAKKADASSGSLGKTLGGAVKTGLAAVAAVATAAVAGLTAAAESTREYRAEMGKLEAAYAASNHSTATASAAYKTLIGVIGETDQSVEAAQQIALLADSEKEVAAWSDLAAGVVGRFGDALQPETFYEAANETMKLGESTGAYTQMLEGCGINVEKFNEKLAACKTTEEKQAYLLEVTEGALGKAGEAYKETNKDIIAANQATDNWMQSVAGIGAAVEPIITTVKNLGAALLNDAVPHVERLAEAFQGLMSGDAGASGDFAAAISGLVTGLVDKITQALPGLAQLGVSIISTLATSLAQQLPTLLSTGGQIVSQLLTGIVSNLPSLAQSAMTALSNFVQGFQTYLPMVVSKGAELLGKLGEGIKTGLPGLISQGLDILMKFATTLYDNAPALIDAGIGFIKNLVQGILDSIPTLLSKAPEIISKFANIINDNVPRLLKGGFELVMQIVKGIIAAVPSLIQNAGKIFQAIIDVWQAINWVNLGKKAFTALKKGLESVGTALKGAGKKAGEWILNALKSLPSKLLSLGKTALTNMRTGITSMAGAIRAAAGNILTVIVNALKSLPSKLLSLGKQAITFLGNAIRSGVSTVGAKAQSLVTKVVSVIKTLPNKVLDVGTQMVKGIWSGIQGATQWIKDKITGWVGNVTDFLKSLFGIESPSKLMRDEIGQHLPSGIAVGVEKNAKTATDAMGNLARDIQHAAETEVGGLSFERDLTYNVRPGGVFGAAAAPETFKLDDTAILAKLDSLCDRLSRLQVVLDSGATVGGLIDKIDAALATRQVLASRGV